MGTWWWKWLCLLIMERQAGQVGILERNLVPTPQSRGREIRSSTTPNGGERARSTRCWRRQDGFSACCPKGSDPGQTARCQAQKADRRTRQSEEAMEAIRGGHQAQVRETKEGVRNRYSEAGGRQDFHPGSRTNGSCRK